MDDSQSLTLFGDTSALTPFEAQRLEGYECTIERGVKTFVEVGNALLAIRDERLYRTEYDTFEKYCRERWGFVASRARQLIAAAEVASNLESVTSGNTLSERIVRPLVGLEPDRQREVFSDAVDTAPNGKVTAAHVQRLVDEYETHDEEPEPEPIFPTAAVGKMAVHFSSDTPEHYTPKEIVEAVIECFGTIDLDPCSNSKETPNVPATTHYTIDDDGLAQHWHGKVYMNPPYGREIGQWVQKFLESYLYGDVTEAIALVPARPDTQWWKQLNEAYPLLCFVEGRLRFVNNDDPAPFPSAVIYLGHRGGDFWGVFQPLGETYQRLHPFMIGT